MINFHFEQADIYPRRHHQKIGVQLILKLFASILMAIVIIVASGLSGLSFYLWPTTIDDHVLSATPNIIERLRKLQSEHKFDPDMTTFYPGAVSEIKRAAAQAVVDSTIQSILTELPARPRRSTVLSAMKRALTKFDTAESEERDQVLIYLTQVLQICGMPNSAELFNVWRYGFPYGCFH